jgi:hypothetical protein
MTSSGGSPFFPFDEREVGEMAVDIGYLLKVKNFCDSRQYIAFKMPNFSVGEAQETQAVIRERS